MFMMKSKAVTVIKVFEEALEPRFKNKLPAREDTSLDLAMDDEKAKSKAKVKNALEVYYLILSSKNEEQLGYLEDTRSDELPTLLAYEIWASLEDGNKPSDTLPLAQMLKKRMKLKLLKNEDLNMLGKRIAVIQHRYMCKVDKNQKFGVVVNDEE